MNKYFFLKEHSGIFITIIIVALIELVNTRFFPVPNPPVIYLVAVVYATFKNGMRAGIISGLITYIYAAYFLSEPGKIFEYTPERLQRLLIITLATPAMVLMVGTLKKRADRAYRFLIENELLKTKIEEQKKAEEFICRRNEQLLILSESAQKINDMLEIRAILRYLVEYAIKITDAESGFAGLMKEGRMIFDEYNHKGHLIEIDYSFDDGQGIPGRVMLTKTTYISNDAENDPHVISEIQKELNFYNLITTPILNSKGELIGCFEMHNKKGHMPFDEVDAELLTGLAASAAIAIDNTRLYEESIHHAAKLEDVVLERTKELQESELALINLVEDLNEKSAALEKANIKLKELDRLKSMFIASMSHELRTPLNSIIGFTSIMLQGQSGNITDEQRDQLERVYRSGKHLLSLVTDIIDISKIESGKIHPYLSEFSLSDVIDEACENFKSQAEGKGIELKITHAGHNVLMLTDRRRFLQCLINFISNSVKFTEQGSIEISAYQENGFVKVTVSDTGIGIRNEDIDKLFMPFVRLDSHLRISTPGTGLGLYLTKKIATEMLGGEVSVESILGKGSTFSMRIPINIGKT